MGIMSWLLGDDFAAQIDASNDGYSQWAPGGRSLPRHLQRMAVTPIGQAAEGELQRFSGRLEFCVGTEPIEAPLTGRRCAYYELMVEEQEGRADDYDFKEGAIGGRRTHLFDWGGQDFYLVDESGRARVHQRTPSVLLQIDHKLAPKIRKEVPPELAAVLERLGAEKAMRVPRFNGLRLLLREGLLERDERIDIWATPRWEAGVQDQSYREAARELWLEGGGDSDATFIITDRVKKK